MNGRGTIVYVHGAGDRAAQVADHVARMEAQLAAAGMPFDVMASRWGEAEGAKLDRIDLALPAPPASPAATAALADGGPLGELSELGRSAVLDDAATLARDGRRESDQLLDICRANVGAPGETLRLGDGNSMPLGTVCRLAAQDVAASPEYAAARAAGVPESTLVPAVGRAVAATAAARTVSPVDAVGTIEVRIAEAVLAAAAGTLLVGYLGIDVGPDLKRWATDVLVPHRARIIREAGIGPADVVLYQRDGERIRAFVAATIAAAAAAGRPVVALGNSLGGIVLVDTLAQARTPRPDLLVTVGSQAPLLATFGALGPLSTDGAHAGAGPFEPWLNVYDRRDLLGFVASRVWPGRPGVEDHEVDMGVGFPDSHGASYLSHPRLYRLIAGHPALARSDSGPAPVSRRFPIRLGRWARRVLWVFGVNEGNAYVELDGHLDARFGFFRLRTPVSNIARWRVEGPWLWLTAIGVRRGIRGDITFGGNHRAGVRLDFREPVRWLRFLRPPALYVTVADVDGLAAELATRGIPGEDARTIQ